MTARQIKRLVAIAHDGYGISGVRRLLDESERILGSRSLDALKLIDEIDYRRIEAELKQIS